MMGMRLLEMEATDALDVIHVLLEEDSTHVSEEARQSQHHVRRTIYGNLYNQRTRYGTGTGAQQAAMTTADGEQPAEAADAAVIKPYMPPTDPEQLAAVLAPPMG